MCAPLISVKELQSLRSSSENIGRKKLGGLCSHRRKTGKHPYRSLFSKHNKQLNVLTITALTLWQGFSIVTRRCVFIFAKQFISKFNQLDSPMSSRVWHFKFKKWLSMEPKPRTKDSMSVTLTKVLNAIDIFRLNNFTFFKKGKKCCVYNKKNRLEDKVYS